ncbi:glycosyltransferase family 39 protein [Litorilinea aerophila]|uniref:Phospholipid carrier-dependent glycosyltransferase n=1 Tax=Litorilinea aerophila TaxID=1204385 RepID=A0A540VM48_9CHLR|nr:glycosyltransferase family 39 protein [Litorilinea aerophila]MCC9074532.1 glycosyltransferase family 39 protein [Litorilinea aerophila]OUC06099.1 hypothetical protein RY27_23130 [Litorilinea aerophila]
MIRFWQSLTAESTALAGARPAQPQIWSRLRAALGQRQLLAVLLVALAIWLPRGFQLDQYVTVDESKWLVRSANFYEALVNGHYQHTFQHGHPGVTIMWAGTAGFLWKFPAYARLAPGQFAWTDDAFTDFLNQHGLTALEMLAAGRTFIVLANALVLALAFWYAWRLLGLLPATLGFALIAFSPFHSALSRLMHPDSLLSTFLLFTALAYLHYLHRGRRPLDLLIAGLGAALTILTKTPGIFLFPLLGLYGLVDHVVQVVGTPGWRWRDLVWGRTLVRFVAPLAVWVLIFALFYFLMWPALWVAPVDTLREVLDISGDYALQGHSSPIFFDGRIINGDPGSLFYPVTYLWRSTPPVLLGLLLGLVVLAAGWGPGRERGARQTGWGMLAIALFFTIFMDLGAKKFDRYLLPVYMPLDIVAGLGWGAATLWLARLPRPNLARWAPALLAGGVVLGQAGLSLPTYPYYITYYNPLMGGPAKAPEVMLIGWGEGLDEAARYLNETVDPNTTTVSSWYPRGPFSYFYKGVTDSNRAFWEADYDVIYHHQWQRELPSRRMMAYFNTLTPVKTISLNGIEYVRIYDMRQAPAADYTVEWGNAIRLVYYDTFSGAMYPGMRFDMTMYLVKVAPLDKNLNILVRLVNADGHELMRVDGWPEGMATAKWPIGEVLRSNDYKVDIPPDTPPGLYRIEVSFYDPATLEHLPVTSVNTGELLPEPYVLDYLIVGDLPETPRHPLEPPADLGGQIRLFGADLLDENGQARANKQATYGPGEAIRLRLFWRALDFMYTDYTAFVHLVGPDGTLIGQQDKQPLDGFIPTSYWPPRQIIADDYTVPIPADAPAGTYTLRVGLYDLATMARLPVTRDGEPAGDAVTVAEIPIGVR